MVKPELQVLAMSRSGHHAYIEWLIGGRKGYCVHHNYVQDRTPSQSFLYHNGTMVGETFDPVPEGAWETANFENREPGHSWTLPCRAVLFIRDIYNCMASRLKANKGWGVATWIAQAKEALGLTNLMGGAEIVLYNDWRQMADWPVESVAYNRGSSFGSIDGVDDRWKQYVDHDEYRDRVIRNQEAAELNEALFGWRLDR